MDCIQRLAGRASSVARATSVSRQFEPTSGSTFMRAGSVARGYEVSAVTVPCIQYYSDDCIILPSTLADNPGSLIH